jgi:hypothetical protein
MFSAAINNRFLRSRGIGMNPRRRGLAFSFVVLILVGRVSDVFAQTVAQLPSCVVSRSQLDLADTIGQTLSPIFISLDGHGNFYSTQLTPDGQNGLSAKKVYLTTQVLQAICDDGGKVAFIDQQGNFGVVPKPYVYVNEFANSTLGTFYLSSRSEDSDFITRGNAGNDWKLTSNRFRLPRTSPDMVPVHLYFGRFSDGPPSHLYTADPSEVNELNAKIAAGGAGFVYERIAFYAQRATRIFAESYTCNARDMLPAIRLSVSSAKDAAPSRLRYVSDMEAAAAMRRAGWTYEGASFCVTSD